MSQALIARLTEFLAHTQPADLPEPVIRRACLVLADTIGVIISGVSLANVGALADLYPAQTSGATVFGLSKQIDPIRAILVNTASASSQEVTEGSRFARGHIAVQVAPATLAQAETSASRGIDTVTAFVLAYELAARIGMASKRLADTYSHGTWGVLGSALACARLRRYPVEQVREAIQIASTLSLAPLFETHFAGATVRNSFAGIGGMIGWTAAELAQTGFTGLESGIERTFGQILGESFDPDLFLEDLGETYLIERNYFKFHACERHLHPALDALEKILAAETIAFDSIAGIDIKTYFPASRNTARQVNSPVDARVSFPYAFAARLVLGTTVTLKPILPEALRNEQIQQVMQRVNLSEDPAMTALCNRTNVRLMFKLPCTMAASIRGATVDHPASHGEFDEPLEG